MRYFVTVYDANDKENFLKLEVSKKGAEPIIMASSGCENGFRKVLDPYRELANKCYKQKPGIKDGELDSFVAGDCSFEIVDVPAKDGE